VDIEYRGKIVVAKNKIYISSTSFQDFVKCARERYYRDFKGLEFLGVPSAALKFGSAFHTAMEAYWKGYDQESAFTNEWAKWREVLVPESYSDQEGDWWDLSAKGSILVNKAADMLQNVLHVGKPFIDRKGRPAVEVSDHIEIVPGVVITRTYDAIVPVDGIPMVIDFKTSSRAYTVGKDEEMSEQLTAYLLPHSLEGVPQPQSAGFLVATKTKTPEVYWYPTKRDEERLKMYEQDVKAVARMIRAGIFPRSRDKIHCGYCEYYDICYATEGWKTKYKRPAPIKRRRKKKSP